MPFINVKTNKTVSAEKKQEIENKLSDAISLIPGKSDRYLMLAVEDGISMMFHRDADCGIAMVEVKIFGKSDKDSYTKLTQRICEILDETAGVSPDCCYVKFEEVALWGYNGFMF